MYSEAERSEGFTPGQGWKALWGLGQSHKVLTLTFNL